MILQSFVLIKYKLIIFYILFFLLIEFSLHLLFGDRIFGESKTSTNINYNDQFVHHDYIPNNSFITYPSEQDSFDPVSNNINSFGIRGPELQKKKKYRVLNIGDSFVQADEVDFNKTFGQRLNEHFHNDIEFISHGMSSWSPTTIFSWIYHNGSALSMDEVNLFLCVNDFYRKEVYDLSDEKYREEAIYEDSIPIGYEHDENGRMNLIKKSAILTVFYRIIKRYKQANINKSDEPNIISVPNEIKTLSKSFDEWPKALKENVDETLSVIKKIHTFLQSNNVSLNILMVPLGFSWKDENVQGKRHSFYNWSSEFTVSQKGIERYLLEFIKEHSDINYIDLREGFENRKKKSNQLLYHEFDGHWNEHGHEVVFQIIKHYYQSSKHYKSVN